MTARTCGIICLVARVGGAVGEVLDRRILLRLERGLALGIRRVDVGELFGALDRFSMDGIVEFVNGCCAVPALLYLKRSTSTLQCVTGCRDAVQRESDGGIFSELFRLDFAFRERGILESLFGTASWLASSTHAC